MNRKGFLLAEAVLKIILAVIAIGVLAYLLFALYNANQDAKNLELARASLDHLSTELDASNTPVQIYNPKKWFLATWPNNHADGKPLLCDNSGWVSCICICKRGNAEKCDSAGVCLENIYRFEIESLIKITNPPITLNIDYSNKKISKV